MENKEKILKIQKKLVEYELDGWLFFDNHGSNHFFLELFDLSYLHLTRRFFYWIPKNGVPVKIVHQIEMMQMQNIPGESKTYLSFEGLRELLKQLLHSVKKIAMEYSHLNKNPYVSIVDAGTLELVKESNIEIVSSSDLLQHFTSVLTDSQIALHFEAADIIEKTVKKTWNLISDRLRAGRSITEFEVQKFILSEFLAHDCITEDGPCCSVNANSASPHHVASKKNDKKIHLGDLILIDLWCKKKHPHAIYADQTRVAVADSDPTPKMQEIFDIVLGAQDKAIAFLEERMKNNQATQGYEVDQICRKEIIDKGYGPFFIHRTGHNIDCNVHGAGAHLDSLENWDERQLLPNTLYSLEPAIYLPGQFGVRIEDNILLKDKVIITTKRERSFVCLV